MTNLLRENVYLLRTSENPNRVLLIDSYEITPVSAEIGRWFRMISNRFIRSNGWRIYYKNRVGGPMQVTPRTIDSWMSRVSSLFAKLDEPLDSKSGTPERESRRCFASGRQKFADQFASLATQLHRKKLQAPTGRVCNRWPKLQLFASF